MSRTRIYFLALLMAAVFPRQSFAQDDSLAALLAEAFTQSVRMTSTVPIAGQPTPAGNPHEAHFIAALATLTDSSGQSPALTMNKLIVSQLDTFPIGSSSGGFVFNYDPGTGLFRPASQSFGPGFAERALTNGRGRIGLGLNWQTIKFESFDGVNLEDGSLQYVLQHNDCCAVAGSPSSVKNPAFEGDLIQMSVRMGVKSNMVAPYFSVGLTDRWDLAAVVPIVHVALRPTITSTIDRLSTGGTANAALHSWDGTGDSPSGTTRTIALTGNATGIGDIVLRTKYRFADFGGGGVAGGLDVRLPSGDKDNLLGTGAVRTKLLFIASGETGHFSPHVNIGYTFSNGELSAASSTLATTSDPANPPTQAQIDSVRGVPLGGDLKVPNEFNYVGGFDVAAHSTLTFSADIIGRTVFDTEKFETISQAFQYRRANDGEFVTTNRPTFSSTGLGNLNLVLGVVGAKFNIPGTQLLLTGSLMFPITDGGLKPKITPVIGVDYSFRR